jgi:hypothetical protein
MTIEQTVEIPPNCQLSIAVPPEVPNGLKSHTPHSDQLLGLLSGQGDMTLEEIRD